MKLLLSERDRFALFVHLNALQVKDRADGRRLDRVWSALNLDAIVARTDQGAGTSDKFDGRETTPYELSSSARDDLLEYLDRPMMGGIARLLVPVGEQLVKDRDGGAREHADREHGNGQ